jgi:hypothetical protein
MSRLFVYFDLARPIAMPVFGFSVVDDVLSAFATAFRTIDESGTHGTTPYVLTWPVLTRLSVAICICFEKL